MAVGIEITVEKREKALILHLVGRLDTLSSPILEQEMSKEIEKGEKEIFLDFSRVDYLSSAGLRVLLSNSKKLKMSQGKLVIYAMTDDVMEIVKMAGFEKVLNLSKSEKDALIQFS